MYGVRFVAIAKTKSGERKIEGGESRSDTGREQTDQLGCQIGKCMFLRAENTAGTGGGGTVCF